MSLEAQHLIIYFLFLSKITNYFSLKVGMKEACRIKREKLRASIRKSDLNETLSSKRTVLE